ncbi:MAG: hypothetical protein IT376_07655 [Polyangiaceae bacterium]|nr:hypothetical protein [Polyangiaceae bacterium]
MRRALSAALSALTLTACAPGPRGPGAQGDAGGSAGAHTGGTGGSGSTGGAPSGGGGLAAGGSGGTGGGATDAGIPGAATLPAGLEWLGDSSLWVPVPGAEPMHPRCRAYYLADPAKGNFTPATWAPCGAGCEVLDLDGDFGVRGYAKMSEFARVTTHREGGLAIVFASVVQTVVSSTHAYAVTTLWQVSATATKLQGVLLAVEPAGASGSCEGGLYEASNMVGGIVGNDHQSNSRSLYFASPFRGEGWRFAVPASTLATDPWVSHGMDDPPALFATGRGGVLALLDMTRNEWTTLETQTGTEPGVGEGDLSVWIDHVEAPTDRLRGWAPDGAGVRTLLAELPEITWRVGLSATKFVGAAMSGPGGALEPDTVRLWHSPRVYGPATGEPAIELGPAWPPTPIEGYHHLLNMPGPRTWGDHALAMVVAFSSTGGPSGNTALGASYWVLARLSDWALWRRDTGLTYVEAGYTLDETHAYVAEQDSGDFSTRVRRLRRFTLSELDTTWTRYE